MGRLDGDLWSYPGFFSLTVPYPDVNDFYFSGHVGSCTLIFLEYRASKWRKMSYWTFFILSNQWIMMMSVRTHYIIDFIGGVLFANYCHRLAEKVSYLIDIKIMGVNAKKRGRNYFKPCKCCGWSNKSIRDLIDEDEYKMIKSFEKNHTSLLNHIESFDTETDEVKS
jgi:hypothetical protein